MKKIVVEFLLKAVSIAIMLSGLVLLVSIVLKSGENGGKEDFDDPVAFVDSELASYGDSLDILFYLIYAVGIAAAAAAVGFGLYLFIKNLITDFKSQVGSLIGIVVFVALGLVSYYTLADGTVLEIYEATGTSVSQELSVFAGGSLIYIYILGLSAFAAVIWFEVSSIIK